MPPKCLGNVDSTLDIGDTLFVCLLQRWQYIHHVHQSVLWNDYTTALTLIGAYDVAWLDFQASGGDRHIGLPRFGFESGAYYARPSAPGRESTGSGTELVYGYNVPYTAISYKTLDTADFEARGENISTYRANLTRGLLEQYNRAWGRAVGPVLVLGDVGDIGWLRCFGNELDYAQGSYVVSAALMIWYRGFKDRLAVMRCICCTSFMERAIRTYVG